MITTPRDHKLASVMLDHSLKIKPKEKVLITTSDSSCPLVKATFIETLKRGAFPIIDTDFDFAMGRNFSDGYAYNYFKYANEWQLNHFPDEIIKSKIDWADAFVRIVSVENTKELNQISQQKIVERTKLINPYREKMINSDRWILTYYPTNSMAQDAGVSYDWLMNFYFGSCLVDYKKMEQELMKLEKTLDKGKKVQIIGKDSNLTFSIEGRLAKAAYGERNIPDGEVFLAPVAPTVEGTVYFDFPTQIYGTEMSGIFMQFEKGKVVKAKAQVGQKAMERILNSDEGARSLGELGIGANYKIKSAMKNTLFDEKIGGTIHLALGRSYAEKRGGAPVGGNESVIHWDIVKNMRPKGSQLLIDGKPILKEGKFTI